MSSQMPNPTQSPELDAALRAARAAESVINTYYSRGVEVRMKADRSPVTVADTEAEGVIREVLTEAFPDYGIYGEEGGFQGRDRPSLWLVDPIDGTKSFVRGYPFFSTQIALMRNGELVLGVSCAPAFGQIAWAEHGCGAFLDGAPVRVSDVRTLEDCTVSFGNMKTVAGDRRWKSVGELVRLANRTRGYGDFYHYHLLASGRIDLVIESDVNILDIAALSVLVEEAGGCFTDLTGKPLGLETTNVLASNGPLHALTLDLFGEP
jgi:histidinol-phosphatase